MWTDIPQAQLDVCAAWLTATRCDAPAATAPQAVACIPWIEDDDERDEIIRVTLMDHLEMTGESSEQEQSSAEHTWL